jgi:hypothetical protein
MLRYLLRKIRPAHTSCPCETLEPVDDKTWERVVHHVPNRATRRAFRRSEAGKGITHYESVEELVKHLRIG